MNRAASSNTPYNFRACLNVKWHIIHIKGFLIQISFILSVNKSIEILEHIVRIIALNEYVSKKKLFV